MEQKQQKTREKEIPEYKTNLVKELVEKLKHSNTILVASTKGLPSSQFHEIKKSLRGKAEIKVAKKSLVIRAIEQTKIGELQSLKDKITSDIAIFFSEMNSFDLSALLSDNQSPAKAKPGDIPLEDINVEPGPTDLIPGPAISELSSVGLKVAVEGGKLAIKLPATLAKAGEPIKENVASVLVKLNILPMKVGFEPIAAYDSGSKKIYFEIKIDRKKILEELRECIKKGFGFAVGIKYPTIETIRFFISKAAIEEKALNALVEKSLKAQPAAGGAQ